jgi:hypothetical protein
MPPATSDKDVNFYSRKIRAASNDLRHHTSGSINKMNLQTTIFAFFQKDRELGFWVKFQFKSSNKN